MNNYLNLSFFFIFLCFNSLFSPKIASAFNPEHLQKLLTTKECINCDLTDAQLIDVDLQDANLTGSNLTGANLTNSNLRFTNLTNTQLKNANLSYTKLFIADLTGADLTNTNFTGADLERINIDRTSLLKANLKGAILLGIDSLKPEDIESLLEREVTINRGNEILAQYDDILVSLKINEVKTEPSNNQVIVTLTKKDSIENITIPLTLAPDFEPYPGQRLPVRIIDLDGDNIPEIIIDYFSGGAHCCLSSQIFRFSSFDDKNLTYTSTTYPWFHTGYHLKINLTTGLPEFSSYDNRFAYRFSSFAHSRFPLQIWQYRQGEMIDVTRQYPELLQKQAKDLLTEYEQLLVTLTEDGQLDLINSHNASGIGGVLSGYLAVKSLLNELEDGWKTLEKLYQGEDKQEFFTALENFLQVAGYIPNSTIDKNLIQSITTPQGVSTEGEGGLFFSKNGDTLIWALFDRGLQLWDWQKGESKGILGKDEILTPMTVSNQDVILTLSQLKLIKWDLNSGKIQRWESNNQDYLDLTSFLTEGDKTIVASQIITNEEGKEEVILVIYEYQHPDEKYLLKIYAPESNQILKTYEIKEELSALFLDYKARKLVYSTSSNNLYLMNIDTGEILNNFSAEDGFSWIYQMAFHENTLITVSDDNKLQVWDITSGKLITSWLTNASHLAIHPQGKVFATTNGYEGNVQLWRLPD